MPTSHRKDRHAQSRHRAFFGRRGFPAFCHPGGRTAASADEVKAPAGPIVVHVRNAKSGDIEVFSGTSQTRLRDTDLAARIARAIG